MTDDPKKTWHTAVDLGDITLEKNGVGDLEFVASDACYSGTVDLQKAKLLTRVLLNFISAREGAAFVIQQKDVPSADRTVDWNNMRLLPKEEARNKFDGESRSQIIIGEIYRGGTRASVVERLLSYDTFRGEANFVPRYLDDVLSKIKVVDS